MPWRRRKSSAASLPIDWTKLSYCHGSSMVAAAGADETGGAPDGALRGSAMISPSLVVAPDVPTHRMASNTDWRPAKVPNVSLPIERKSVGKGKGVSVRVDIGGG